MKKLTIIFAVAAAFGFSSCKKCIECSYFTEESDIKVVSEFCGKKDERLAFERTKIVEAQAVKSKAECEKKK